MAEVLTGSALVFESLLEQLVRRGRESGLLVVPGAGAADIGELVAIAVARAARGPDGVLRSYTALLSIASQNGQTLLPGSWERIGEIWEAIGGTWAGRVSPELRGVFVWVPRR